MTDTIEPMTQAPIDQQFAQDLVDRARAEGVDLTGPGGLLTGLTKQVLETALETELAEHLGYDKHAAQFRRSSTAQGRRCCAHSCFLSRRPMIAVERSFGA
jgi:hypothetical protein